MSLADTSTYSSSAMYQLSTLLTLSAVAAVTALDQRPLIGTTNPLSNPQVTLKAKNLVNSSALEAHITEEKLLKRANQLYKIAELGIDEYNHPTRVIGSKGIVCPILILVLSLITCHVVQDILPQ